MSPDSAHYVQPLAGGARFRFAVFACSMPSGLDWPGSMQTYRHSGTAREDAAYRCCVLTFARDAWVRRMGNLPAELAAVLEGRYCISRIDQNMRPIFMRNLASWKDNPRHKRFFGRRLQRCCDRVPLSISSADGDSRWLLWLWARWQSRRIRLTFGHRCSSGQCLCG